MENRIDSILEDMKSKEFSGYEDDFVWQPTENFEKKMRRIRIHSHSNFTKRKAVIILVAAIVACITVLTSFKTIRDPIFRFFSKIYDSFVILFDADKDPSTQLSAADIDGAAWIPREYRESERTDTGSYLKIVYENGTGKQIVWKKHSSSAYTTIDNESEVLYEKKYENALITISSGKSSMRLVYIDDDYLIVIQGPDELSVDDMLKILGKF